jgi:hypothetical protein
MFLPSQVVFSSIFKASLQFLIAQADNSRRFFTNILVLPLFRGRGILLLFLGCFSPLIVYGGKPQLEEKALQERLSDTNKQATSKRIYSYKAITKETTKACKTQA